MSIETLDDIVEELMDRLGIYGAHDDEKCSDYQPCRCCATSSFAQRIRRAAEIEQQLSRF